MCVCIQVKYTKPEHDLVVVAVFCQPATRMNRLVLSCWMDGFCLGLLVRGREGEKGRKREKEGERGRKREEEKEME